MPALVEQPPFARGKETLNPQLVTVIFQQSEVLFEPEPLGGGFVEGVGDKEKNSGHWSSGAASKALTGFQANCRRLFVILKTTFKIFKDNL